MPVFQKVSQKKKKEKITPNGVKAPKRWQSSFHFRILTSVFPILLKTTSLSELVGMIIIKAPQILEQLRHNLFQKKRSIMFCRSVSRFLCSVVSVEVGVSVCV